MLAEIAAAAAVTLIAELADKTMLTTAAVAAATRRPLETLAMSAVAFAVVTAATAWIAGAVGGLFEERYVAMASSALFVAAGIACLRAGEEAPRPEAAISAFTLLLLSELGDKTQMSTAALALRYSVPSVVLGALIGYIAANAAAIAIIAGIVRRRPMLVSRAAAATLIAMGLALLVLSLIKAA